MKNISLIDKFCKNFIIEDSEAELIRKTLHNKINLKQNINVFCSFTFITPNYRAVNIINTLAKMSKILPNVHIHLILSDNNILTQDYLKSLGIIKSNFDTEMFINSKVDELKNLLVSFGANPSNIHIYRFSEIWSRLLKEKSKNLFLEYYSSISKIKLNNINLEKLRTVARVFQFSLDMYVSTIFHLLFPYDVDAPIDFFYGRYEKKELYNEIRDNLYDEGFIKIKKPLFLFMHEHPDLIFKARMPEWNMSREEIYYIIENVDLSEEDHINIIDFYKDDLKSCSVMEGGAEKSYKTGELTKKLKDVNDMEKKNITTSVVYSFLQEMKSKLKNQNFVDCNMHIKDKDTLMKITRLLRTKHILDILDLSDGTNNLSEISSELGIPISNLSKYVKGLKEVGLVCTTEDKKLNKVCKRLRIDIDHIN
ncbi:hypothetical protein GF361_02310 [Candidatus Woesearchaeota archaeon]|nr:hypothetical protein [Candidatus Woesearchaeota archaeon]